MARVTIRFSGSSNIFQVQSLIPRAEINFFATAARVTFAIRIEGQLTKKRVKRQLILAINSGRGKKV
jgi:hypothetical protein